MMLFHESQDILFLEELIYSVCISSISITFVLLDSERKVFSTGTLKVSYDKGVT